MEVSRDVVRDVELARGQVVDEALACGVRRAVDKVVGDGRIVKEEADGVDHGDGGDALGA